jgi:carbamoyltransferase
MQGGYLGPEYSQDDIEDCLTKAEAKLRTQAQADMIETAAQALADGKAVGWFQGRMEFGPRALGGRSFLSDSRSPEMQKLLNLKIKYRELFRPFTPAVLRDDVSDWFEIDEDSPYMLMVADVVKGRRRQLSQEE